MFLLVSWQRYVILYHDIRKNIEKIVFRALSSGAIRILLRCSGAEIYRFLMLHSKKIILQFIMTENQILLLFTPRYRQKDRQIVRKTETDRKNGRQTKSQTDRQKDLWRDRRRNSNTIKLFGHQIKFYEAETETSDRENEIIRP